MFRYRSALESISDAYCAMGSACTEIFRAEKEIAKQIPAVSTQDIRTMTYNGAGITREKVRSVRASLGIEGSDANRRRSAPPSTSRGRTDPYEPPPPYA